MGDNEVSQVLAAFNDFRVEVTEEIALLKGQVALLKGQIAGMGDKVDAIQSTNRWFARTVGGVLIAAILTMLIITGGGHL